MSLRSHVISGLCYILPHFTSFWRVKLSRLILASNFFVCRRLPSCSFRGLVQQPLQHYQKARMGTLFNCMACMGSEVRLLSSRSCVTKFINIQTVWNCRQIEWNIKITSQNIQKRIKWTIKLLIEKNLGDTSTYYKFFIYHCQLPFYKITKDSMRILIGREACLHESM